MTLAANAIAPGVLDRYLGRVGFDNQQMQQKSAPGRPGQSVGTGGRP